MTATDPANIDGSQRDWAERFEEAELPVRREHYRRTALLAIIFMLLGCSLDMMVFPYMFGEFLLVRAMCAVLLGALLVLIPRSKSAFTLRFYVQTVALLPAVSILWMIYRTGGGSSDYYAGLNLVLVAASLLLRWPFGDSVLNAVIVCGGYLIVALASDASASKIFNNVYFVAVTAFFSCAGTYYYNALRFREFRLYVEVESSRRELAVNHSKLQALDEAKTLFFANVSHELRTPLTLILGPLEQLRRAPAVSRDGRCAELVNMLEENGLRLLRLINDLLDLVRLDGEVMPMRLDRVDMQAFINGMADSLRPTAETKQIRLRAESQMGERLVGSLDRDRLEKIVLNLAINAIKFTPSGGSIDLIARSVGEEVEFVVRDTGRGIKSNELPFVFERFWQADMSAKRKHGGVGIGLALVRTLTESMGGRIDVKSEEGRGTTFTVTLPWIQSQAAPEGANQAMQAPDIVELLHQKARLSGVIDADDMSKLAAEESFEPADIGRVTPRLRLLVADDEPGLRRYLASSLGDYEVIEAREGREALQLARQYQPDLAILDYMMPELDGIELTRQLRAHPATSRMPIVLVTANAENAPRREALEAGVNDFLTKPFSTVELGVRVRNLLDQARFERDLAGALRDLQVAHEDLKENEAKLLHAERISGLGTMSAGIIHEINNPLNYTTTAIQVLKSFTKHLPQDEREDFDETVKDAAEGVKRVATIVSDLRAFTTGTPAAMTTLSLAKVLESSRRMVGDKLSCLDFTCDIAPSLAITGNEGQLVQVFMNLFQNSASFVPAAEARGERPGIRVSAERSEGGFITVTVWDNGSGISPKDIGQIFDPFFTKRDVGAGMGLGLSICHQILEQHNAKVEVRSELNKFTEFTLCFPPTSASII